MTIKEFDTLKSEITTLKRRRDNGLLTELFVERRLSEIKYNVLVNASSKKYEEINELIKDARK